MWEGGPGVSSLEILKLGVPEWLKLVKVHFLAFLVMRHTENFVFLKDYFP